LFRLADDAADPRPGARRHVWWARAVSERFRCARVASEHFVASERQVSYEKQIAIIDKIMKRVIEYCKVRT
jgi:hypothetical protein